jgi:hypothetical protein
MQIQLQVQYIQLQLQDAYIDPYSEQGDSMSHWPIFTTCKVNKCF